MGANRQKNPPAHDYAGGKGATELYQRDHQRRSTRRRPRRHRYLRGHTDVFPASKGECTLRLTLCLPCSRSLTGAALSGALNCALLYWRMLDHLISEDPIFKPAVLAEPKDAFTPMARASTAQVQTAQVQTADFLSSFGLAEEEEMISSAEADVARAARDYFRAHHTGPAELGDPQADLRSPARFTRYAAQAVSETLPAR